MGSMKFISIALFFLFYIPCGYAHIMTPAIIKEMEKRLAKNPNDIEALLTRAHHFFNIGKYKKSVANLEQIRKNLGDKKNLRLFLMLANLYFKLGKLDKALHFHNEILTPEFCKKFARIKIVQQGLWERAIIYSKQGKHKLAWQDAKRVKNLTKDSYSLLIESGKLADKAGEYEEAIGIYSQALLKFSSSVPENIMARVLTLLIQQKKLEQVQTLLNTLVEKNNEDPLSFYYRSIFAKKYLQNEKLFNESTAQALKNSDHITKVYENIIEGAFWKARIFILQEKWKKSLESINIAIKEEAQHPVLYKIRAKIYHNLKQKAKEQADLKTYSKMLLEVKDDWLQAFSLGVASK